MQSRGVDTQADVVNADVAAVVMIDVVVFVTLVV